MDFLVSSIERGRDRSGYNNDIPRAIIVIDFDELRLSNIDSLDGKFEWKFFFELFDGVGFSFGVRWR